jgi:hypothetical protein
MTPTVDQLLDLLLDGDPVAWQITREGDDLRIVGLMQSGETVLACDRPRNAPRALIKTLAGRVALPHPFSPRVGPFYRPFGASYWSVCMLLTEELRAEDRGCSKLEAEQVKR